MNGQKTTWRIVLIDDEPGIRKITGLVLADWGFSVETAENGEAGLARCREVSPQIVITDVKMPGMDGLTVLARIKEHYPETEVIVMTAFGDIETAIKAIQLNASDFITKPVNDQALELALDRAKARYTSARKIREYTRMLETGWSQATREMANQEKVLHQDKMASLGKLAASVVHEINNPLSGILNYLKLMAKMIRTNPDGLSQEKIEKFAGYLDISTRETARCSEIISNLLVFSRKSTMANEPVDICTLLERCRLLSQHKLEMSGVTLTLECPPDIPLILADANQIQQCLINLIFNALDAIDAIDAIDTADTISATGATNVPHTSDAAPENKCITLWADSKGPKGPVQVHIKDTGSGIAEKDLPYIFDPFYTTKAEGHGVGLGLSTVYGIIQRHGGTIQVVETGPSGTHFVIEFNTMAKRPLKKV